MHDAFAVHMLNEQGKVKAKKLADAFTILLDNVQEIAPGAGREQSLVITHLELASFYAKKAMAKQPENQQ